MKRLVILDDDIHICDFIAAVARHGGWQADTAQDVACFSRHMATPSDGVFVDLQLGGTDGLEVLRDMAARGYAGPVVLISGFNERVLQAARAVGAGYGLAIAAALKKPLRAAALRDVLAGLRPAAPRAAAPRGAAETGEALTLAEIEQGRVAGEMTLHFQPIVRVADGVLAGVEALTRWRRPARGPVPPDRFIPVVEADGPAMDRLTGWTIEAALAAHRRFAAAGIDVPVAVNISGQCLRHQDFPNRIAGLVARAGCVPGALGLEITESIAVVGAQQTMDILTRLRLRGFEVAIDDLGAGYASLQALLDSPFSYLKIDKSFVAGVVDSRQSAGIVRAIAEMARAMALRTVAEGVESAAVAAALREMGVDALQGAWLSMPVPAGDLISWETGRARGWFGNAPRACLAAEAAAGSA